MNNSTPNSSPRAAKKQLTPEPEYAVKDSQDDRQKKKHEDQGKRRARQMKFNGG